MNSRRRALFQIGSVSLLGFFGLKTFSQSAVAQTQSVPKVSLKAGESYKVPEMQEGECLLIEPEGPWEERSATLLFESQPFCGDSVVELDHSQAFLLVRGHGDDWFVRRVVA